MIRKCGTCRFYRDAAIAGSGWCVHPGMTPVDSTQDERVLVRGRDLACRTVDDVDLWEATKPAYLEQVCGNAERFRAALLMETVEGVADA